jgi:nucleotide-binding universal stress UspA family protein
MPHKMILVPVDGSDAAKPAIETAILVGKRFSSHVVGFHVRANSKDAVPLLGEGMSGAMIEEIIELAEHEANKRSAKAWQMFNDLCAEKDISMDDRPPGPNRVSAAWIEETGREDEAVARRGRLSDLIVAARPTAEAESPSSLTRNAAIFETGRPVLVAPPKTSAVIGARLAIFWNGSAQAARAMAAAIPFIIDAESVTVINAEGEGTSSSVPADLVTYLAWRGVTADTRTVAPGARADGEVLLDSCSGCDLLVMGAYTHSRVRRLILGGVTKHVLSNAAMPVLMGH